jgi:hypothetical protein
LSLQTEWKNVCTPDEWMAVCPSSYRRQTIEEMHRRYIDQQLYTKDGLAEYNRVIRHRKRANPFFWCKINTIHPPNHNLIFAMAVMDIIYCNNHVRLSIAKCFMCRMLICMNRIFKYQNLNIHQQSLYWLEKNITKCFWKT